MIILDLANTVVELAICNLGVILCPAHQQLLKQVCAKHLTKHDSGPANYTLWQGNNQYEWYIRADPNT
jgi:hypothetical protein